MPIKYKLLLVEDDENLGFMLKDNLEMSGYEVRLCRDGALGLTAFHNESYHLCIFDVMLPFKDGFTLAEDVRKYNQKIPIIFLTAKSQKDDRIKGFKLGGDDYITKPFSLEEFLLRIEAVLKRVYDRPTTADQTHQFSIGKFTFDFNNQLLFINEKSTKLTNKEARLLKILVQHKNQVVERDVIMKTIWEDDGYFVARSMDVFISKLRKYLEPDPSVNIKNVHGVGYRLEEKNQ
ncbi:MAG: response regulator transcription factor [Cyclobacteriaceae bacterium]|nr:response regulator transcription factor [Cyclobacteriaceae bacterium]